MAFMNNALDSVTCGTVLVNAVLRGVWLSSPL
uniref:Uncharacterized protein n=1 Tax=Anguilla anguilla TaxID=7936 RepID=A0A0E9R8H1_ANGAN